jgi:hypothetical protein
MKRRLRKGAALLMSMIVLATLSVWAVSIYSISGVNVQLADNQCKADGARAAAESGLEVVRFWLSRISVSGTTAPNMVFSQFAASLQHELNDNSISNIAPIYDGSSTITIIGNSQPTVTLDSGSGQSFTSQVKKIGSDTVQVTVTGNYGPFSKTIQADYMMDTRAHNVFDFGVATKGPLSLSGNIQLEGVNISVESDVYIESENSLLALSIIGNSQIAGNVSIANSLASVFLQGGKAGIGGETGQAAVDNHVKFGVAPTEFPTPNPQYFEHYVTSVINSSTDTTANATYENVRIAAGTNPNFTGNVTLKGVVYVETPNVVTFAGNAAVTGIIVGNGSLEDNSGVNQVNFLGGVVSNPVSDLPDETKFVGIKGETGTFMVAPGFHLSFGGNFQTLNGAIAGNGVEFFGNAGGTIRGSVINYSEHEMTLSGNSDLYFNRSGLVEIPAGFVPEIILKYLPGSYSEP